MTSVYVQLFYARNIFFYLLPWQEDSQVLTWPESSYHGHILSGSQAYLVSPTVKHLRNIYQTTHKLLCFCWGGVKPANGRLTNWPTVGVTDNSMDSICHNLIYLQWELFSFSNRCIRDAIFCQHEGDGHGWRAVSPDVGSYLEGSSGPSTDVEKLLIFSSYDLHREAEGSHIQSRTQVSALRLNTLVSQNPIYKPADDRVA